jgi:hypothetical protein
MKDVDSFRRSVGEGRLWGTLGLVVGRTPPDGLQVAAKSSWEEIPLLAASQRTRQDMALGVA